MNCEELMDVLDNGTPDRLDAGRRRQVDAHMAVCADCARAWNLQAGLAGLPDVAMPAGFAARCRAVVAAGIQPVEGRRVARTGWLVGAASLAAVAAVLVFLLRPAAPATTDPGVRIVEAAASRRPVIETVSIEPVAAAVVPAAVVEAVPEPKFTVRLVPYAAPTEAQMAAVSTDVREIYGPQVRANSADPSREQAMQSLHAALIEELRKVPGLTLVDSDPVEMTPSRKHYRLSIGIVAMVGFDGRAMSIDSRYIPVSLSATELQPGGKIVSSRVPASSQIDLQAACSGGAPGADPCYDPRGAAASLVQTLLRQTFPPHPTVTRPLQAKFQDASLDLAQRLEALDELYKLQARAGDASLLHDPGVVRAAIGLAATADPVLRARIWRSLRGAGNAELIQPMLGSLAQDPDDVRLAALEVLSADFLGDQRVRSALEATAQGDRRPLVRAVAQRGLSGEAPWRQYVVASLKDSARPAPERVEALVYTLYPPGPTRATTTTAPDYFQVMQELLDDDAVRALAEAIPDSNGLGAGANNLLGNFSARYRTHPAVPPMLLRVLENDPKPLMRAVAAQNLALFNADEPRIREALLKARDSDPDANVRSTIRQILGSAAQ